MLSIHRLLLANTSWAEEMSDRYPDFFSRLADGQQPEILWVGCSDSRVPAERITNALPGELFVERNIANIAVADGNASGSSVLEYAVGVLQVRHIIVCGHTGCGGARAALSPSDGRMPNLDLRISALRALASRHADELDALPDMQSRGDRLAELNVADQLARLRALPLVQNARQPIALHGWLFDLSCGGLRLLSGDDPASTLA